METGLLKLLHQTGFLVLSILVDNHKILLVSFYIKNRILYKKTQESVTSKNAS